MEEGGNRRTVAGDEKIGGNNGRFGVDRRGAVQQKVWDDSRRYRKKGFVDEIRDSSNSYYFTNFSDNVSKRELWKAFSMAGDVVDVFIPAKVDKLGRRFGFVRYQNERDLPRLERRLQQIWLGTYKLQINRSHSPIVESNDNRNRGVVGATPVVLPADTIPIVPEKPNSLCWGQWPKVGAWSKMPFGRKNMSFNMEYEVNEERFNMLSGCYVGILAESRSATALEFQHSLLLEGYQAIKVTPMGGDSVLLSSPVEGLITEAINSNRNWWSTWL